MSHVENHDTGEWLVPASSFIDAETKAQRCDMNYPGSPKWWQSQDTIQGPNFPGKRCNP